MGGARAVAPPESPPPPARALPTAPRECVLLGWEKRYPVGLGFCPSQRPRLAHKLVPDVSAEGDGALTGLHSSQAQGGPPQGNGELPRGQWPWKARPPRGADDKT